ncbi:MAG: NeuD/PglB/VioB family sugar acetyltransferase [Bacteroidia bacterium]|jgi:sugar O-acyltransferase (sialic acid O-acetyltransferase NeuD family)
MKSLILIGGGGHCKSCIDVIESEGTYTIAGILDSIKPIGERVLGYPILGKDTMLEELAAKGHAFFITIGQIKTPAPRIALYNRIEACGAEMPVIISPLAHVSKHAKVGKGSIIMHYALVNAAAEIGHNCIINSRALVEHDALIGNHCHISTGALINGGAKVGDFSFIGSGAVFREGISLPENSFIKANSLVK